MTREEAIKAIDHLMYSSPHESTEEIITKKYYAEKLIDYIADAEPIRHGTWTRPRRPKTYERFCSCCGCKSWYCGTGDYAYCPNYGAKMDEVTEC